MTPLIFASEGFGLNLNIFETNIINLAVVVFGLYKFCLLYTSDAADE